MGDGPKIPIGNHIVVENINWEEECYLKDIKTSDNNEVEMTIFKVFDGKLYGDLKSNFYDYENSYFILDMKSRDMLEFKSKEMYDNYTDAKNQPKSEELMSFSENYKNRWSGWRFWLLP